jgi:tRNA pseudouridine32 synthase / 23S rRNA pseudouridine746 synthase
MSAEIVTQLPSIHVLFENNDIIAVDKPEKLASIPERNREKISLLGLLTDELQRKLFVVHRIDKQVSGIILFAKNAETHRYLNALFEHRRVRKTYLALVHGLIEEPCSTIDKPLRRFGSGRMGEDAARGKPCVTEIVVVERLPTTTLTRIHPLTGRKHQIRAHLFAVGHPAVGDPLYGNKSIQKTFPRLMLHALNIRFTLPDDNEIFIESRIPESFQSVLGSLRALRADDT